MEHVVGRAFVELAREYAAESLWEMRAKLEMTMPHRPAYCEILRSEISETEAYIARCDEMLATAKAA